MDNNQPTLTKTCSSCGLQKPLSAFLELSGPNAGSYGNICASCRKTNLENAKKKDTDEGTRSDTGDKIDTKTKVAGEIGKKEHEHKEEVEYHEERDKDEVIESELGEKKEEKYKSERKHREGFLEKRTSFLDKKKSDSAQITKTFISLQNEAREERNIQENIREEQKKGEIDLTGPFEDTRIAGKEKFKGIAIRSLAALMGTKSALGKTLMQTPQTNPEQKAEKSGAENKESTLSDVIKETWPPNTSGRRR